MLVLQQSIKVVTSIRHGILRSFRLGQNIFVWIQCERINFILPILVFCYGQDCDMAYQNNFISDVICSLLMRMMKEWLNLIYLLNRLNKIANYLLYYVHITKQRVNNNLIGLYVMQSKGKHMWKTFYILYSTVVQITWKSFDQIFQLYHNFQSSF